MNNVHLLRKGTLSRWQRVKRWFNTRSGLIDIILAGLLIAACVVGFAAFVFGIFCFGGLIFYVGWNVGLVACVEAAGGTLATISFWNAVGATFAITVIKGILSSIGRPKVEVPETK